jgi:hypothetical protein
MTFSIMTFSIMTFSIMTFSIKTFSINAFSIKTFSMKTFSIKTFSIKTFNITTFRTTTLSIMYLFVTLCNNYTQHDTRYQLLYTKSHTECRVLFVVMLSVVMPNAIILNVVGPCTQMPIYP